MNKQDLDNLTIILPNNQEIMDKDVANLYYNYSWFSDFAADLSSELCYTKGVWLTNDIEDPENDLLKQYLIAYKGFFKASHKIDEPGSIRPVIDLSGLDIMPYTKEKNGVLEVELGEYPQSCADPQIQVALNQHKGVMTGRKYSIPTISDKEKKEDLNTIDIYEYEYQGKRYVSLPIKYKYMKNTWYEVEPITWLVDQKYGKLISKKIMVGRVIYKNWIDIADSLKRDMILNSKQYREMESVKKLSYKK